MSGYLEIKISSKSGRSFPSWKTWKKLWCILMPCPIKKALIIKFHTSAGMSSNSQIEIPENAMLCRIESNIKKHVFAIFSTANCGKPILYAAGQSESEVQLWMLRIRIMLHGKNPSDKFHLEDNQFNVSLIDSEFSKSCGYRGVYGLLVVKSSGFQIIDYYTKEERLFLSFYVISNVDLIQDNLKFTDNEKVCIVKTNSYFKFGEGVLFVFCLEGKKLYKILKEGLYQNNIVMYRKFHRRFSRSEGNLFNEELVENCDDQRDSGLSSCEPISLESRTKWYCSLQDIDDTSPCVLRKKYCPSFEKLSGSTDIDKTINSPRMSFVKRSLEYRISEVSAKSEIYEEISDEVDSSKAKDNVVSENIYEPLININDDKKRKSVYPPPLPPRHRNRDKIGDSATDSGVEEENTDEELRSSTFSYKRPSSKSCVINNAKSVMNHCSRFHSAFGAFRNRIKSESQISRSKYGKKLNELSSNKKSSPLKLKKFLRNKENKTPVYSFEDLNIGNSCEGLVDRDFKYGGTNKRFSKSAENIYTTIDFSEIRGLKRYGVHISDQECNFNLSDYDIGNENVQDLSILCAEKKFASAENILCSVTPKRVVEDEYVIMSPCVESIVFDQGCSILSDKPKIENNYVAMK